MFGKKKIKRDKNGFIDKCITFQNKFVEENSIFADAFNFFAYDGKQVIDPNSLVELDTREIGVPYGGETGAEQPVQRTRDIAKSVTAMTDQRGIRNWLRRRIWINFR